MKTKLTRSISEGHGLLNKRAKIKVEIVFLTWRSCAEDRTLSTREVLQFHLFLDLIKSFFFLFFVLHWARKERGEM